MPLSVWRSRVRAKDTNLYGTFYATYRIVPPAARLSMPRPRPELSVSCPSSTYYLKCHYAHLSPRATFRGYGLGAFQVWKASLPAFPPRRLHADGVSRAQKKMEKTRYRGPIDSAESPSSDFCAAIHGTGERFATATRAVRRVRLTKLGQKAPSTGSGVIMAGSC